MERKVSHRFVEICKKIDTSRYGAYRINDHCFCKAGPLKGASDMIVICESLFQI